MKIMGLAILLSAFASLAIAPPVLGDPASHQSAWTRSPIQPDADLRDPLVRRGKEVFQARCQACHGDYPKDRAQGGLLVLPPMPGTQALQAKYKGEKPALLEQRTDLTPEVIAVFVRHGTGSMPFFRPTELSDGDLKALGAYLARSRH